MSWISIVKTFVPVILATIHGGKLAPLSSIISYGITEAEGLKGANGPTKLAHAINLVNAGISGTNTAAGRTVIDPTEANAILASGIATVVSVVNAFHKSV